MDSGELDKLITELTKTTVRLGAAAEALAKSSTRSDTSTSTDSSPSSSIVNEKQKPGAFDMKEFLDQFSTILGTQLLKTDKSSEAREKAREKRESNRQKDPRAILVEAQPVKLMGIDKSVLKQLLKVFGSKGKVIGAGASTNDPGKQSGKKTDWKDMLKKLGMGALAAAMAPLSVIVGFFDELGKQKWFIWLRDKLKLDKIFKPIKEFFMGKTKGTGVLARISRLFGRLQPHITKALDTIKKSKITKVARLIGRGLGKLFVPLTIILGVIDFVKGFMKGKEEEGVVEGIKQGLVGVVEGLVGGLIDLAGNIVGWLLELVGLDNTAASVKTLLDDGMNIIYDQIGGIVDVVAGIFTFDIEKMKTGVFAMMDGSKNAVGWILDLAINPVTNFFRDIFGLDGEFKFSEWSGFDKLPNARELFDKAWKSAGAVFTNFMSAHPYMKEKWDALKNGVSNFATSIKSKWNAFTADPKAKLTALKDGVLNFAGNIKAKWDKFKADPKGALKDLGGKVASWAGEMSFKFQSIVSDPKGAWKDLKGRVSEGAEKIKANFNEFLEGSGAKAKWVEISGKVSKGVDTIKTGYTSFMKGSWNRVSGLVTKGIDTIKAGWGKFIPEGAKERWDQLSGKVAEGAKFVTDKFNAFKDDPKKVWDAASGKVAEGAKFVLDKFNAFKADPKKFWDENAGKVADGAKLVLGKFNAFFGDPAGKWKAIAGKVAEGAQEIGNQWNAFREDPGQYWSNLQGKFAEGASFMRDKIDAAKNFARAQWDKLGAIFSGPVNWMKEKFAEGRKKAEIEEKRKELAESLNLSRDATQAQIEQEIQKRQKSSADIVDKDSTLNKAATSAGIDLTGVSNASQLAEKFMERSKKSREVDLQTFINKYTQEAAGGGGYLQYGKDGDGKTDRLIKIGGPPPKSEKVQHVKTLDDLYALLQDSSKSLYKANVDSSGMISVDRKLKGTSVLAQQQKSVEDGGFGKKTSAKDIISNISKVTDESDPLMILGREIGLSEKELTGRSRSGLMQSISKRLNVATNPEIKKKIKEFRELVGSEVPPGQTPASEDTTASKSATTSEESSTVNTGGKWNINLSKTASGDRGVTVDGKPASQEQIHARIRELQNTRTKNLLEVDNSSGEGGKSELRKMERSLKAAQTAGGHIEDLKSFLENPKNHEFPMLNDKGFNQKMEQMHRVPTKMSQEAAAIGNLEKGQSETNDNLIKLNEESKKTTEATKPGDSLNMPITNKTIQNVHMNAAPLVKGKVSI
jgi:hypothetical protein